MNKNISIIVGSVLGATEYVADAIQNNLEDKGYTVQVFLNPTTSQISKDSHWIICTSTHGAGDLPDNIQNFSEQLEAEDLTNVTVTIIGLGDSSYDTFCNGALTMEKKLLKAGCTLSHPLLTIDVLHHPIPEEKALEWIAPLF